MVIAFHVKSGSQRKKGLVDCKSKLMMFLCIHLRKLLFAIYPRDTRVGCDLLGGGTSGYRVRPTRPEGEAEKMVEKAIEEARRARIRNVFISFHVDDEAQVNLLRAQAKNENFDIEFRDYSVKEPFDEKWKTNCKERISQTSALICMIGEKTAQREAVIWEINEAYRQGKKVIGVRIYRDKNHRIPKLLLEHNAPIVDWNLARISKLLEER